MIQMTHRAAGTPSVPENNETHQLLWYILVFLADFTNNKRSDWYVDKLSWYNALIRQCFVNKNSEYDTKLINQSIKRFLGGLSSGTTAKSTGDCQLMSSK